MFSPSAFRLCLIWSAVVLRGQSPPPQVSNPFAGRPEAIEAGRKQFSALCGGCHGATGQGGRGPNLVDGDRVQRFEDTRLFETLQKGIAGTEMRAFPLSSDDLWQIVSYTRSLNAPAAEVPVPGHRAAGKDLFYGQAGCSACHAISGLGGVLGPDLTGIGSRRPLRGIRESILDPSVKPTAGYEGVEIVTSSGRRLSGVAKNRNNYSIQMLDRGGELHLLPIKDVRTVAIKKESLMPTGYGYRLSATQLTDLIAYLSGESQ